MKNLDIEKLERKNIYSAPDHFFDDVQARVLQETVPQKQAKIITMNWAYAAAAAVALLFGVTFIVTQGDSENAVITESQTANVNNVSVNASLLEDKQPSEATVAYQTLESDLTSTVPANQIRNSEQIAVVSKKAASAEVQRNTVASQNPEVQVDQILANFTSAELADLGKNAEQDVYLDLYY